MKFTLDWLKEHLETSATLDEIADALNSLGLEVESIENLAETLAPFKVAHVVSAEKHPDADKLSVCKVDTGSETVQVVCGAPNARTGMKGVFAPSGTTIPGTGLLLKPTKIRGVESNGMLVSEREMGLSDEHEGIIELPDSSEVGTPMADIMGLNDPVIEIAITPNRPDCLGVRGIARDLAARGIGTLKPDHIPSVDGKFDSSIKIGLNFPDVAPLPCAMFAGCYVRGVKNGPSPDWLQKRLRAIDLRPISKLVDITNLIAFDRGRPLHVYDADKLSGNIGARPGRKGEKIAALDGEEYDVDETVCVIADESTALGIGGVIGGEPSGVTEQTTNVFIESAYFDPIGIAATGRRLGIESDARYRFERGVDPDFVLPGVDLAVKMVVDLCGGEPSRIECAGGNPRTVVPIAFDPALVKKLTGMDVAPDVSRKILEDLGFSADGSAGSLSVTAPGWRPDIDGVADLVEEIVRVHGLDNIPSTPLTRHHGVARPILTTRQKRLVTARRTLATRGMVEAVTWSFISEKAADLFGAGNQKVLLANPISSEMNVMRPSVLPGLIEAAQHNADRGFGDVALFESGPQYAGETPEDQAVVVSGIRSGATAPRHWQGTRKPVDTFDAKADAMSVLEAVGGPVASAQVMATAPGWYHPGRSGTICLGPKKPLAYFGEIHPRILQEMDMKGPVVGFEIMLDELPEPRSKAGKTKPALDASDLQAVERDFAFVVASDVHADTLVRAAKGADKKLITSVSVFDVFEDASLGDGNKSVALTVHLQPREKTLTDEEIDVVAKKVTAAVEKASGGTLRG